MRMSVRQLLAACALILPTAPAFAGDLLVAPTRVVLDGARGTELYDTKNGAKTPS